MTGDQPKAECPTPCDPGCELRPDGCHEEHQLPGRRGHQPVSCPDLRRAIDIAAGNDLAFISDARFEQRFRTMMRRSPKILDDWLRQRARASGGRLQL